MCCRDGSGCFGKFQTCDGWKDCINGDDEAELAPAFCKLFAGKNI